MMKDWTTADRKGFAAAKRDASEAARTLQARRKRRAGGRPKVFYPCPYCAKRVRAAKFMAHVRWCQRRHV